MTDYVPGQLSSLFTQSVATSSTSMTNAPVDAVKTKRKKRGHKKTENAAPTTSSDTSLDAKLVALFDNSIKAEPKSTTTPIKTATTSVPSNLPIEKHADANADEEETKEAATTKQQVEKVKKNKNKKNAEPVKKKSKRNASDMEVEDMFEKIARARALAVMESDSLHKVAPKSNDTEDKMEVEMEQHSPVDDSDDSDSDGTDVEMDDQKLIRPRKKDKVQHASRDDDPTRLARTVFVGNLPTAVLNKTEYRTFKKYFAEYGKVESIRFRSIAFSRPLARRIAFVSKQLHKERDTLNAYVVFDNETSATAALAANGAVLLDHHLRVDRATGSSRFDRKRCVFVGNLSFDAQEELLWRHFGDCGRIVNVRMVRDRKSNVGKGFAYVEFEDKSAVGLAMRLHDSRLGTRTIRVQRCLDTRHNNATGKPQNTTSNSAQAFEGERAVKGKPIKLQAKRRKHHVSSKKRTSTTTTKKSK
ncbi:hypothetical protein BDF22DRAFT_741727 [Syncephalis plumigaleata]|nr:hypothetical protein BDF22DRAFT_741727 [Syncephalis plumigaleata]